MTSTTEFSLPARAASVSPSEQRKRRIDRESGRALEILGHAIDYLTDEMIYSGSELATRRGEILAVQLLMARNRQIYLACPVVPTLRERLQAWLHLQPH